MIAPVYERVSDLDLKNRWVAGDESAFNELYVRHWPRAERSALNFKTFFIDPEERVSIANFTFGVKSSLYDGRSQFSTFMYDCVRNRLLSEVRIRRSHGVVSFVDMTDYQDASIDPSLDPSEVVARRDLELWLNGFLQSFPDGEYEFLQAYLASGSRKDAAHQVGIHSCQKLRDFLENLRFRVAGSLEARGLSLRELL
ncbi:MAG: hypothetical protein Q7R96_00875 [Nanoarchaeota archaeon]|nr:hypothetical protein [Nanoarchaeota archaeon]